MKQAIKLAIEKGGWERWESVDFVMDEVRFNGAGSVVLDPQFWAALGKALGWENINPDVNIVPGYGETIIAYGLYKTWLWYALRYHELVLTGGDVDKFWEDLLK